jgi:hypothetical protein
MSYGFIIFFFLISFEFSPKAFLLSFSTGHSVDQELGMVFRYRDSNEQRARSYIYQVDVMEF